MAPSTGSIDGGEPIEITGADFQEDAIVYFGASRGSIVSISEDRTIILATSPAASEVGTVNVTVVNEDDATTSNAKVFAYVIYAPEVLSILPNTGTTSAANTIAIEGTGFRANDDNTYPKVRFLGDTTYEATAVQFLNTGRVLATTPADMDEGYYNVQIENADGQTANSANTLHLQTPQGPAPIVDSITPSSGLLNESKPVEISGSYFSTDPLPTITINGAEPTDPITVTSDGLKIILTMPPAETEGAVTVRVANPDGQNDSTTYTYLPVTAPAPVITNNYQTQWVVGQDGPLVLNYANINVGFTPPTLTPLPPVDNRGTTSALVDGHLIYELDKPCYNGAGPYLITLQNPDFQSVNAPYVCSHPAPRLITFNETVFMVGFEGDGLVVEFADVQPTASLTVYTSGANAQETLLLEDDLDEGRTHLLGESMF